MLKTICYTTLALVAFAANSILARLALAEGSIDAASFTVIRLLAGIAVLVLLVLISKAGSLKPSKSVIAPSFYLFGYMVLFSFAYLSLGTGTGALILFGAVQIVLLSKALLAGERWQTLQIVGFCLAAAGFVYLVWPSVTTPSIWAALMMIGAGVCWAAYTLAGRGSVSPLLDSARYFVGALPLVGILAVYPIYAGRVSFEGVLYAVISGAVASGLGYAIWYKALPLLSASNASVLQLLVPVIAALGGITINGELLTFHLVVSSFFVLGGVLLVLLFKNTSD